MDGTSNPDVSFDPVPPFDSGVWRQRLKFRSSEKTASVNSAVQGANRCKYFYQPFKNVAAKENKTLGKKYAEQLEEFQKKVPFTSVCAGTQTDYRESEVQTDPWDPPYRLKEGSPKLDVLTLSSLEYGKGLPVGIAELEEIAWAQGKRHFEANLPKTCNDKHEEKQWRDMVYEQITKDVAFMKKKVRENLERKLLCEETALLHKYKKRNEQKDTRLQKLWAEKKTELSEKTFKLQEKFSRRKQKLEKQRSILTKKHLSEAGYLAENLRAVLSDSAVYKSKAKKHTYKKAEDFYLDTAKGLVELECWLWEEQKIVMEPEIYLPKKEPHPTHLQKIIEQAQKEMMERKAERLVVGKAQKTYVIEKRRSRPTTPTVTPIQQDVLDRHHAAITLQKTLRGRAMQKEILEVRNRYISLIHEMRKTYAVLENEQAVMDEQKKEKIQQYLELKKSVNEMRIRDEILCRFEGRIISDTLNIMARAVERHQQWKEVDHIVQNARDERRRREAAEAGLRQKEMEEKQILNYVFERVQQEREDVVKDFVETISKGDDKDSNT